MKNKQNLTIHHYHASRAEHPGFPHGHKNGAKVAGYVVMERPEDGRFGLLMVRRENSSGRMWWEAPGGSMELRDCNSPKKAVTREIFEETGVYAEPVFKLEDQYRTPRGRSVDLYWCEALGGVPVNVSHDEHLEVAIITPDQFSIQEIDGRKQAYIEGVEVQMPVRLIEALVHGQSPGATREPEPAGP